MDVATGPRNLSIKDVEAISGIYGHQSSLVKGSQFKAGGQHSIAQISDRNEHRARRRLFDQGLSPKRKAYTSTRITKWIKTLTRQFLEYEKFIPTLERLMNTFLFNMEESHGQPVAVNRWLHYFTFDAIGQLAFETDYQQLETGN